MSYGLDKSFATSVSPWITPLAALAGAVRRHPSQEPVPAPHLRDAGHAPDRTLETAINGHVVSRADFAPMYWTCAQMLAHVTSNGSSGRTGDLDASGTVSGAERGQRGSLLELTWNGTEPMTVGKDARTWLLDGDEVALSAHAGDVTPGDVRGRIVGT